MQHYSPARLQKPLLRVGRARRGRVPGDRLGGGAATRRPSGSATSARTDPKKLAFFTGRDQSQSLTGWWAMQFGTPNYRGAWRLLLGQHGGGRALHDRRLVLGVRRARLGPHALFHAVRRRRGPRLQPDQDRRSASSRSAAPRSSRSIPVRTGYTAIADEWIGIRPGTDGLFVLRAGPRAAAARRPIDLDYLVALHQRAAGW